MNFIDLIDNIVKTQQVFHSILEGNEAQTRWMLIDPLILDGLGYSREDIIVEYSLENRDSDKYNKLDYSIIVNNKPKLLVEAKSLGVNLYEKYSQLEEYFLSILNRYSYDNSELIGILTDGDKYLFYTNKVRDDKMDKLPFYTIQLSISEDIERKKLLNYSKSNISKNSFIQSEEEYELGVPYRIDMIESVFNFFESQNKRVDIDKIYLNGRMTNIKSFRSLYRELLNRANSLNPNLLYQLAYLEDSERNGKISSTKFSLRHINSTEILYPTVRGDIYITIPSNRNGVIDRIIYLSKMSNLGVQNILVSLRRKIL